MLSFAFVEVFALEMADDPSNDDQWLYGDSITDSLDANNDTAEERKLEKLVSGSGKNVTEVSIIKLVVSNNGSSSPCSCFLR